MVAFHFEALVISGAGNPQAPILGIANPLGFRRAFMEFQDLLRVRVNSALEPERRIATRSIAHVT